METIMHTDTDPITYCGGGFKPLPDPDAEPTVETEEDGA
jgi:hypothetical protein